MARGDVAAHLLLPRFQCTLWTEADVGALHRSFEMRKDLLSSPPCALASGSPEQAAQESSSGEPQMEAGPLLPASCYTLQV